jgi:hypothetical protein
VHDQGIFLIDLLNGSMLAAAILYTLYKSIECIDKSLE